MNVRRAAVVGLSILSVGAVPAHADSFASSLVWQGVPQAADFVSTNVALSRGGVVESNPLMSGSLGVRAAKKLAFTAAFAYADHEVGKQNKKFRWVLRGIGVATYGYITVHNLREGKR